jgi:hypothetical protein
MQKFDIFYHPKLFNKEKFITTAFASEYVIRNIQENLVRLKFNRTYQLLAYADAVNIL